MRHERQDRLHTRMVKAHSDRPRRSRPLDVPIVRSNVHETASSELLGEMFRNKEDGIYTRFGHPTISALAGRLASLEEAESALAFSSGMAAISTTLAAFLRPGDHVVAQREIFAQTQRFLREFLQPFGVVIEFVDAARPEEVARACRPETSMIYVETPSNPLLQVVDLRAIAAIARRADAPLLVDGTFAGPALQNPLAEGATLVLHSGTKYIGGHSDVMCGFVAGDAARIARIKEHQILFGGILDPHAAWLVLRGIKTLAVRVERQSRTALQLARILEGEQGIRRVHYPWLAGSPSYEVARRQMRGGGGMISFEVEGGLRGARAFVDALETISIATSLGGVESTIEVPWELDFSEEELGAAAAESGVVPGLVRLSVGIEDVRDLAEDLRRGARALGSVLAVAPPPRDPLGTASPPAVRLY